MDVRGLKVLMVAESSRGGGAEQVASLWRTILSQRGARVRMAILRTEADAANESGTPEGPVLLPRGLLRRIVVLRRLINTWRPDTVIGVLTYPNLLAQIASIGLGSRLVLSEHTIPTALLSAQSIKHKVQLRVARATYRYADAIVAVSHAAASDLLLNLRVRPERLWLLPNQVALPTTPRKTAAGGTHPASKGDTTLRLLVPGRITSSKRPALAIDVAKELQSRGHKVTLEFIGTRAADFPLSQLASAEVEVAISPWSDQWARSAEPGSIVLLTSAVEGFGNVLVEAARAGLSSVASSSALGVGDAVIDGVTGILASPDSPSSFADAVEHAQTMTFGDLRGWFARFEGGRTADQLCRLVASTTD